MGFGHGAINLRDKRVSRSALSRRGHFSRLSHKNLPQDTLTETLGSGMSEPCHASGIPVLQPESKGSIELISIS